MIRRVLFLFLSVALTACGGAASPTPTTVSTVVPIAQNTSTPSAVPPTNTATAVPPTEPPPATATSQPTTTPAPSPTATPTVTAVFTATIAVEPTDTPEPEPMETATAVPSPEGEAPAEPTAAATTSAPPPSSGGVEQPPYQASACSDKYPCNDDRAGWEARIRVPTGFQALYFARVNGSPTSITFGPDGRLYVAVQQGSIFRIENNGGVSTYTGGFTSPTGIAFQPGTNRLFVSSRAREENINGEAKITVVNEGQIIGGLPCCYTYYHSANGIAFGSDGWGYVGVGARADHGEILVGEQAGEQDELHPYEASILRFSPDGGTVEVYARGLRNPYDITWDGNGQLWATDNAPDYGPPEELHRVIPGGEHGYPWYDCPECFSPPPDVQVIPPVRTFVPHSSPTGIAAYLGDQFPGYYNSLFVTLWSAFPGAQKVMRIDPNGSSATNFATGFAAPIDVTVGPNGSLYVADWATGIIFKISYTG